MSKIICIVSHKFTTQPDDDLVQFLNLKGGYTVLHIRHSFSDAKHRKSFASLYLGGRETKTTESSDLKKYPEPVVYLRELLFTVKSVTSLKGKPDTYIGMDGLCVLFGLFLRFFGKVSKVVYWTIDFVPERRFKSRLLDFIYKTVNAVGYKQADEMWDLSPRMAEAREKYIGFDRNKYKKHKVVPFGVWVDRVKKYSYQECDQNTIVFMGHLLEKQGVQLILKLLPDLVKVRPDIHFKVIGGGLYQETLLNLACDLGVEKYCSFLGKMEKHEELEIEVAKCCVAVAPYIKKLDTWTYFADPGKVKTYLGCGVPVLLTDIPWNAREIEKNKCGLIISENPPDIQSKILKLMEPKTNQLYRDNALLYAKTFNYATIFKTLQL